MKQLLIAIAFLSTFSALASSNCSVKCTYYYLNFQSINLGMVSGKNYDDLARTCELRILRYLDLDPYEFATKNQTIRYMNQNEHREFQAQIRTGYLFMELLQEIRVVVGKGKVRMEWLVPYKKEICN